MSEGKTITKQVLLLKYFSFSFTHMFYMFYKYMEGNLRVSIVDHRIGSWLIMVSFLLHIYICIYIYIYSHIWKNSN